MKRYLHMLSLLAVGVAMLAAVSPAHAQDPIDQALEYAPPGVCGVVHVDLKAIHEEAAKVLEANKEELGDLPIDAILELIGKADSVDIMMIAPQGEGAPPMPFAVVRGAITPADVGNMLAEIGPEGMELVPGDDGRYSIGPATLVYGKEASDVPEGVLLLGMGGMMAPNRLKNMSKPDLTDLTALLKKTDTSMPVWGAMIVPEAMAEREAPQEAYGAIDPTGKGKGQIVMVMNDEKVASEAVRAISQKDPVGIKKMVNAKQDGNKVNLRIAPGDKTPMQHFIDAWITARMLANRAASMANLRVIGTAANMYATDEDGRFPSDFQSLIDKERMDPSHLDSPLDGEEITWNPQTGEWTGQPDDYVLIDLNPIRDAQNIEWSQIVLAYEAVGNDPTGNVNVLFFDCHVESLPEAEFKKTLAATREVLKKHGE